MGLTEQTEIVTEPTESAVERAGAESGSRQRRSRRALLSLKGPLLSILSVVAFIAVWQYLASSGTVDRLYISAPSDVWSAFVETVQDGSLVDHLIVSGKELLVGFGLAALVGIAVGMLSGWNKTARSVLNPFVTAGYVTPRIALIPVVILWFGIGIESKVAMVFLMAVFPIVLAIETGVRTIDPQMVEVADVFQASRRQLFRTVVIPATVPHIVSALKLGYGLALVGVVVGELYAARGGIGYMIVRAGASYQVDKVFLGVVVFVVAGVLGTGMLSLVERRFSRWRTV